MRITIIALLAQKFLLIALNVKKNKQFNVRNAKKIFIYLI